MIESKTSATVQALTASVMFIMTGPLFAAGFQISEQSVAGLGRAFAGGGVAGDDAADMFYNPAGMMINGQRQFQAGVTVIDPSAKFENSGSSQRLTTPAGPVTIPSGGINADGGDSAAVPNLYYIFPAQGDLRYGIGINTPFGLATDYPSNWVGRFHALKSELKTVDINPAIAKRVNDKVSVGGGISAQYADATLSQAVFLGPGAPEGKAEVNGDNWALGFNLGVMIEPNDTTRIGAGFRSKVKQDIDGDLTVSGTGVADGKLGAKASVDLPETIYLQGFKQINDRVDLLASIRWTNWSRFDELRVSFADGRPDGVTDESWDDSFTLALGFNYHHSDRMTWRAGVAFDQTPVPDAEHRTPRIPDNDRTWLSLGASFQASPTVVIDLGYAHLFGEDTQLNNTVNLVASAPGAFTDTLAGQYTTGDADLFGIQILATFQ